MRFLWRNEEIHTYADWRSHIARKDDQPRRSAPTIAAAWAGPLDLQAALRGIAELADLRIEEISVEAQTHFDAFGGPRNHDLLITATAAAGKVVVAVEAKAGEPFGQTVAEYRAAAEAKRAKGETTNAPDRLEQLLDELGLEAADSRDVEPIRYQLLSATAGTLVAAQEGDASCAVLMIHDFVTDERLPSGEADLSNFIRLMGAQSPPVDSAGAWCVEARALTGAYGYDGRFFIARALSDLRSPVVT